VGKFLDTVRAASQESPAWPGSQKIAEVLVAQWFLRRQVC